MQISALPFRAGAWIAGLAVALGAFGAHGLEGYLSGGAVLEAARIPEALAWWSTGVRYQLAHGLALLALGAAGAAGARLTVVFAIGVVLFSGSLYGLALGGPGTVLGPLTPVGGVLLILGWLALALGPLPLRRESS